ncbi:MAG: FeS-binding protein [Desulfovibrio sp.]|uniref:FeS-binding protein n=1 Tax=Desulfovibrio sp. 7SRBS1 TaxID=3378064 RepID=UPI003B414DCE
MNSPASVWLRRIYTLLMVLLAFTGFSQMPITKRYFIADLPGMGWSADFYFVNEFHYVLAAVFLAVVCYMAAMYVVRWRWNWRLSVSGRIRVGLLALIVVSGIFRVLKNEPDVFLGPKFVFTIDMVHLGAVILLGITALGALAAGARAYLQRKGVWDS